MTVFEYPYAAFLLILPFLFKLFKSKASSQGKAIKIPFLKDIKNIQSAKANDHVFASNQNMRAPFLMLFVCYVLVVLSAMRPVELGEPHRIEGKGRDILLVTDISTSMLEEDFIYQHRRLSRIEAVRAVVADFVQHRLHDRMGLILFGTRAYLQAPLTFDKEAVIEVLGSMQAGMAGQSTSIGDAVALALKTLSQTKTQKENQVIILLTDGENNDGQISVAEAIKMAKNEGIKIYTIGIGAPQMSLAKAFFNIQNSPLDEQTLKELAAQTEGRYFKVTNLKELVDVYQKIDLIEEQDFEDRVVYEKKELYPIPLLLAFILAFGMLFVRAIRRRQK